MTAYVYNKNCSCTRCRAQGLMGPAMIVTTGILWLLHTFDIVRFWESWPVYLLVVGAMILLGRTASTEGHVSPGSWSQNMADVVQAAREGWQQSYNAPPPQAEQTAASPYNAPPPQAEQTAPNPNDEQVNP